MTPMPAIQLDHVTDHPTSEHDHYMELLGYQFCFSAYDMYNNQPYSIIQIAQQLGQTVEDVKRGINAFENYLLKSEGA